MDKDLLVRKLTVELSSASICKDVAINMSLKKNIKKGKFKPPVI